MRLFGRVFLICVCLCAARPAHATIRYRVSLAHPEQHFFHVAMEIAGARNGAVVEIPAWNALYQIRDFAARVTDVEARAGGAGAGGTPSRLAVTKLDKQTWQVASLPVGAGDDIVTIRYDIFWDDPGPFNSQLNAHHAFVNLAEILFYLPDRHAERSQVEFADVPESWKMAVALPSAGSANSCMAASYDALVDAPVEISAFSEFRFTEGAARYRVVVDGNDWDAKKLGDQLRRIVSYETSLMGGAPFEEYIFFFHFGQGNGAGGGGMEHSFSTAIGLESGAFAQGVAAHEFFHVWNVKRIRPQSLEPVDYPREQYTRALWFAEGVTSTYGSYTLERTGLWDRKQFYDDLANELSQLSDRPARLWQSVEQSSLDAWLEKYPFYRRPESSISYYNKGMILGEMLDFVIRNATDNHKSLDDVMRALNERFAKRGRFYNDSADIRAVAEDVCACPLGDFFTRYVAGTDEIPYADLLGLAGLRLKSTAHQEADFGFWPGRAPGNDVVAAEVQPGSNAEAAGLVAGDILLELDGAPLSRASFRMRDRHPGDIVRFRVRRGDRQLELSFALGKREEETYEIKDDEQASDKQRRIRDGWLRGTTQ